MEGVSSLSLDRIEALAPDQGSVDAARKLLKPAGWPKLAADGAGLIWGECQGSGATPYRVVVAEADAGYKCTCPSRKFPCKHSLALMWLRVDGKVAFATAEAPEWVREWVARRRGTGAAAASTDEGKPKVSLAAAAAVVEEAVDPKAEARAAAARERNRLDREASVRAGLDELDLWLEDQVERGMAAFVAQSSAACRVIAQRLVDAKAPGLASRLDGLSARLFSLPEATRALAAIEELGQLHLLAEAYRRQEELPPGLRADVRQAVGWTVAREALLEDQHAERVAGVWRVVAVLSEVQPDRLRRIETWLRLEGAGRFALLLDFVPIATGASASGYVVGERLEAELVFYPSAAPLRALVVRSAGAQATGDALDLAQSTLGEAYAAYESALQAQPWVAAWPLSFREARVRRAGKALFVCDAKGGADALPMLPAQWELAGPLASLERLDGVALWDGRYCTLCWADTELGRWVNG
jgi:hypothetical protein